MAKPGKLLRSVLSEERGECYSPPPNCGYSRATPRGASHPLNCSDANDSVKISEDHWQVCCAPRFWWIV